MGVDVFGAGVLVLRSAGYELRRSCPQASKIVRNKLYQIQHWDG